MERRCELCHDFTELDEFDGVQLCRVCENLVQKMYDDDAEAIRVVLSNSGRASMKARKKFVTYAQKRMEERRVSATPLSGNNPVTFSEKVENKNFYNMKYIKVLSTSEKREWIERYIGIKKFVAGVYVLIGLLVGILVANVFEFGMGGYIVGILLGCGIASALGTNAVGTAMMEAITAEQSIITEELLTELLNDSQKE